MSDKGGFILAEEQPVLHIENLQLTINDTPILHDIDLCVKCGQVLGIIGESGSGKSMTALSVMQLLPRGSNCQGKIYFDGKNLLDLSESEMCALRGSAIGMVFQEPMTALNPVHTIGQQVAECVRLHRRVSREEADTIARETLDRVGLPELEFPLSRYPHELSGGQRQRVVIAMAVALKPKLLIADEPTTALDVTTQAEILKLLKELLLQDNMAMILISHDLAVIADTADQVTVMRQGKILESGEVQSVFSTLAHPYTRQLFQASGHVPERAAGRGQRVEPLLQVKGLVCEYPLPRKSLFAKPGAFRAVDDISFNIAKGESIGLVGESGCGKSTLARALLGLTSIRAGTITLGGQRIEAGRNMSRLLRQQMQVVFQDPYGSFNPRHRVARLIAEPLHVLSNSPIGSARDDMVVSLLQDVGLHADDAKKYIHEFSGGQRQRVAIARALIIKPALIVLDEAVSALDVSVRAQVLDLLARLADIHRLAYLFISHDLSVVRSITDRVIVMHRGRVVEQGDTEQVFTQPQQTYTRSLLAAAPKLPDYVGSTLDLK